MKRIFFSLLLICFMRFSLARNQLCGDNSKIKSESCSTQILGEHQNEVCRVEFLPQNSAECKEMRFGPINPNSHIGEVQLKPSVMPFVHNRDNTSYFHRDNYTVLNISFSNIKWNTMKIRFQRYNQSIVKNHCSKILISSDVVVNDQSVLYYDCFWSETDGNYNGHSYILDFEAADDAIVNRGRYYFNVPTAKMLSPNVDIREWRPFVFVEIYGGVLKLHILSPPPQIKVKAYRIAVMKACEEPCNEIVKNSTVKYYPQMEEVTYDYSVLRSSGLYHFVVTPLHDDCNAGRFECQSVNSPRIPVYNDEQTTYICIASITSLVVATLFAYYIVLRVLRRYWCKDYTLTSGSESLAAVKMLVVYSPANKLHAKSVTSFVNYLRAEYGLQVMVDNDITATSHGNPFIWCQEAYILATHIVYIVGPEKAGNVYDEPVIYRNVENRLLSLIEMNKKNKDVFNVIFDYSNGQLPVETCNERTFFLLKDWQKMIMYLANTNSITNCISKNLLPIQQMKQTEHGRTLLEDLKMAKQLLSKKQDCYVKLENCKTNSLEKKELL